MRVTELLAACFVLFTALLLPPLLSIANKPVRVAGVPALVLYFFVVWGAIVAVLAWTARRSRSEETP